MQNRDSTFTHPGGDTVVMERVSEGLRKLGVQVDVDVEGTADLLKYDLIHPHNFATPHITEMFARKAVDAGVPYVVTTLYEDLPLYYNQMFAQFEVFQVYINAGQPKGKWLELSDIVKNTPPSDKWDNTWTAEHAASLIVTGEREKSSLLRDYPDIKRVDIYSCASNIDSIETNRENPVKEDFILCVGRLETRKNQLGLLKALEGSDITLVFATGGFTHQPEYEAFCRKFKRKGETLFLGRINEGELSGALAAARVHALPSWYELPGIVSIEAAQHNTNIVVTDYGTPRDYFGDKAYYCLPHNMESIFDAVMEAYHSPSNVGLVDKVASCTWENAAKQVLNVYEEVLYG